MIRVGIPGADTLFTMLLAVSVASARLVSQPDKLGYVQRPREEAASQKRANPSAGSLSIISANPSLQGEPVMANLQEMISAYLEGPKTLRRAVAGMTREQAAARPIDGKWSTLEVVCHLADFDPILADRMKRVIAEDKPQLIGADENRF